MDQHSERYILDKYPMNATSFDYQNIDDTTANFEQTFNRFNSDDTQTHQLIQQNSMGTNVYGNNERASAAGNSKYSVSEEGELMVIRSDCSSAQLDGSDAYIDLEHPCSILHPSKTNQEKQHGSFLGTVKRRYPYSGWHSGLMRSLSAAKMKLNSVRSSFSQSSNSQIPLLLSSSNSGRCLSIVKKFLGWKWFWPTFIMILSFCFFSLGIFSLLKQMIWFRFSDTIFMNSSEIVYSLKSVSLVFSDLPNIILLLHLLQNML